MADNINYQILGRKFYVLYPELAGKHINESEPILTDINLIDEIFHEHFSKAKFNYQTRLTFIAVVLKLYDPDMLGGWKTKLCIGVRSRLSQLAGVRDEAISNNLRIVRNYYEIYKGFKEKVDYFTREITNQYA